MNKRITVIGIISALIALFGLFVMQLPALPGFLNSVAPQYYTNVLFTILPVVLALAIFFIMLSSRISSLKRTIANTTIISCPVSATPDQKKQARITLLKKPVITVAAFLALFLIASVVFKFSFGSYCLWLGCFFVASAIIIYTSTVLFYVCGGDGKMILCHSYFALNGMGLKLDGYRSAIYKVELNGSFLTLGVLIKGKESVMTFPLPDDQIPVAQAFIKDLEAHFEQMESLPDAGAGADNL